MANGMNTCEVAVRPFKEDLLKDARQEGPQRVLEVGIGAAPNLSYLVNGAASKVAAFPRATPTSDHRLFPIGKSSNMSQSPPFHAAPTA